MPSGLFSLYIRSMVSYEKNPENSKYEKFMLWLMKITGPGSIVWGIHSLYVYVPIVISEQVNLGLVILKIARSIDFIVFGIALLIYYKKTIHIFSRSWIFVPLMISWVLQLVINYDFNDPTSKQTMRDCLTLIAFAYAWFSCRRIFPEEFGVKS